MQTSIKFDIFQENCNVNVFAMPGVLANWLTQRPNNDHDIHFSLESKILERLNAKKTKNKTTPIL